MPGAILGEMVHQQGGFWCCQIAAKTRPGTAMGPNRGKKNRAVETARLSFESAGKGLGRRQLTTNDFYPRKSETKQSHRRSAIRYSSLPTQAGREAEYAVCIR